MKYEAFEAWVREVGALPTMAEIRRKFGCSATSAYQWRSRYGRAHPEVRPASMETGQQAVLRVLDGASEPLSCGQISDLLGIPGSVVMHALQNLHESSRIIRNGNRPCTYSVPEVGGVLRLMPRLAEACGPLVPSLGAVLARCA